MNENQKLKPLTDYINDINCRKSCGQSISSCRQIPNVKRHKTEYVLGRILLRILEVYFSLYTIMY